MRSSLTKSAARGADLRRDPREHAALAHGKGTRARAGELEDDGRPSRLLDPPHDVADPAAEELEGERRARRRTGRSLPPSRT